MFARPYSVTAELPGGCSVDFTRDGDAYAQYWVGPDAQLFCRDEAGQFRFIANDGSCGELITCDQRTPAGGRSTWEPSMPESVIAAIQQNVAARRARRANMAGRQTTEVLRNLVLMIRFKDHPLEDIHPTATFERLFNSLEEGDLSVRSYYLDESYGQLDVLSFVTEWIEVDMTEAEAAGPPGCSGLCGSGRFDEAIREALDSFVSGYEGDFAAEFDRDGDGAADGFTIIHSGYGAENTAGDPPGEEWIWSHLSGMSPSYTTPDGVAFSLYNTSPGRWYDPNAIPGKKADFTRIFVPLHEFGHFLGLIDMYDYDRSSRGLGPYCVMSARYSYDPELRQPPSMSAPAKDFLGWLDIEKLPLEDGSDVFSLEDVHTSKKAYMIDFGSGDRYYIENRQNVSHDLLHIGGILIYHADGEPSIYTRSQNSQEIDPFTPSSWRFSHPTVRLIQPDWEFDLELEANPASARGMTPDPGDWWPYNGAEFSDAILPLPNLNSYAKLGQASNLRLHEFSPSGPVMTFRFTRGVVPGTFAPSPAPTVSEPSEAPTPEPTLSEPSKAPSPAPTVSEPSEAPTPSPTDLEPSPSPTGSPVGDSIPTFAPTEPTPAPVPVGAVKTLAPTTSEDEDNAQTLMIVGGIAAALVVAAAAVLFFRRSTKSSLPVPDAATGPIVATTNPKHVADVEKLGA